MKQRASCRAARVAVLILAGLASAGCGASPKPHGRLVMNGQPLNVNPAENMRVTFFSEGEPGKATSSVAEVLQDGSFVMAGPTNVGIPPGKYHITVTTISYPEPGGTANGPASPAAPAGGDKFQGRYTDPAKTPLTCEITAANPEIVIDVGKGTVSTGS